MSTQLTQDNRGDGMTISIKGVGDGMYRVQARKARSAGNDVLFRRKVNDIESGLAMVADSVIPALLIEAKHEIAQAAK